MQSRSQSGHADCLSSHRGDPAILTEGLEQPSFSPPLLRDLVLPLLNPSLGFSSSCLPSSARTQGWGQAASLCFHTQRCSFHTQARSADWATFFFSFQPTDLHFSTALREGLAPQSLLPFLPGSSRPAGKPSWAEERMHQRGCPAQEACVLFLSNSREFQGLSWARWEE